MRAGWVGRVIVMLSFAGSFAGCGKVGFDAACYRITNTYCSQRAVCEPGIDQSICASDFEAIWFCDPSATVEELDTCSDSLPTASCALPIPQLCYDAICSYSAGCITQEDSGTTEEPTQETLP